MGSSISSVIAQIVMEDLESEIISNIKFEIPFFFRYVDDCITAIPKDQVNYFLNEFNNYHQRIQFTVEEEQNNKINYLDLTLIHINKNIKTSWYTKKTWSSRYLNYNSNHPLKQRKSVVIGLADRAISLSDPEYREDAINKAKNALMLNKYPLSLIKKVFKMRIHKFYNSTETLNYKQKDTKKYIVLPYLNEFSHQIEKLFKKYNLNIAHKAHNLLGNYFSKLKTPKNKKSNIVYEIPCNDCSGIYIGQTSQYLENRIKGHKYDKNNVTSLNKHEKEKKTHI